MRVRHMMNGWDSWLSWLPACFAVVLTLIGCGDSDPDQRYSKLAEQSLQQQAQQNEQLIEQSQQMGKVTQEFVEGEAAARKDLIEMQRELVEEHAKGRQEMVELQQETLARFDQERQNVDRQREDLTKERQQIAKERMTDSMAAAVVSSVGIILACSLPLLLAGYVLFVIRQRGQADDDALVVEVLVSEFTAERPRLLAQRESSPRLKDQRGE